MPKQYTDRADTAVYKRQYWYGNWASDLCLFFGVFLYIFLSDRWEMYLYIYYHQVYDTKRLSGTVSKPNQW
jgi:hypothetical protein